MDSGGTNSADPDEMPDFVVSFVVHHCLLIFHFKLYHDVCFDVPHFLPDKLAGYQL